MLPLASGSMSLGLELRDLSKRYGTALAVDGVSLQVAPGELLALLGPSGCGKTSTLRMIAGFVAPDEGSVLIGDDDVTARSPERRNVGLVFQNYGLFPHMTVQDNVGYGLKIRKVSANDRKRTVADALAMVHLTEVADRFPSQISGGQQQRTALARAVVIEPAVLLLDEPLSNLDAKLRQEMRLEIRRLHRRLNITTVLVTHDQDEALTMADRVAVMNLGRLEQIDTPAAIYGSPATAFVAHFVGDNNIIEGVVDAVRGEEASIVTSDGTRLTARTPASDPSHGLDRPEVLVSVRPEVIVMARRNERLDGQFRNRVTAEVVEIAYLGAFTTYLLRTTDGLSLRVLRQNRGVESRGADVDEVREGDRVIAAWSVDACRLVLGRAQ